MSEFQPTEEQRDLVATSAGAGITHEEIALGLGISVAELDEHFQEELTKGAHAKRLNVVQALYRAATGEKPNATAARAYLEIEPVIAAPPAPGAEADPAAAAPERKAKLGKKEQAEEDAKHAAHGTGWGDLLTRH